MHRCKKYCCIIILFGILPIGHAQTYFEDVTEQLELSFYESSGRFGSGVSAADFDQDGDIDLFISGKSGTNSKLLINTEGTFDELDFELDFDAQASLFLDYDGDHDLDLFIAGLCTSYPCQIQNSWALFKQEEAGVFVEVTTESGLNIEDVIYADALGGLAAGDLNLDGYLDLVVSYWKGRAYIFMNNRNGGFIELDAPVQSNQVYWQSLIHDFNQDGWPEIYMSVDFDRKNQLFIHDGDFEFYENASAFNLDHADDDMGLALGDVENDGDFDLYITCIVQPSFENFNALLLNDEGTFREIAPEAGVDQGGWSWGVTFADIDNDKFQDIAITNGHRIEDGYDQSKLWMNNADLTFRDVSGEVAFNDTLMATSLISADLDLDGDLDLVQTLKSEFTDELPLRVLINRLEEFEKGNYLVVKPRMEGANHFSIGAEVRIRFGDELQARKITAGTGLYSQEPALAFFGLGEISQVDEVEVLWPGGAKTIKENVSVNQELVIFDESVLHPTTLTYVEAIDQTSIEIAWDRKTEVISGFVLERDTNQNFEDPALYDFDGVTTHFIDSGLEPGTQYFYRIYSKSGANISMFSLIEAARTDFIPVDAPQALNAEIMGPTTVKIEWVDNSDNETGFRLERSTSHQFIGTIAINLDSGVSEYIDENLEPGATYYYRIKAFSANTSSEFSSTVSVDLSLLDVDLEFSLILYPNPSKGLMTLSASKPMASVGLFEITGKKLESWRINNEKEFTIPNLRVSGEYVLRIHFSDSQSISRKIIFR